MSTEATCGKNEPRVALKLWPIPVSRRAYAILFVPLAAGLCALPSFVSAYAVTLAVEVMIAGVFASGINLLTGYTGLVSLGQAMFLGLGGYGIAIGTALQHELQPAVVLPLGHQRVRPRRPVPGGRVLPAVHRHLRARLPHERRLRRPVRHLEHVQLQRRP